MISDSYFDRFRTPKYQARGRLKRALIRRFVACLEGLFARAEPFDTVLEVGCGEGFLSGYLSEQYPQKSFTGIDISPEDLRLLSEHFERIETHQGSIYDLSGLPGGYDLVICAEVLEHLQQPAQGLAQIVELRPRRVILTVPHEPWFMLSNLARGKNLARFGNDIDHVNHYGPRSFRRLVEQHFRVLELATSYPWLLSLNAPG